MLPVILFLFLAYFLLYEPLFGLHLYKSFIAEPFGGSKARLRYYKTVMVGIWVPSILVLLLSAGGLISAATLGIRWPELDFSLIGRWPAMMVLVLLSGVCVLVVYQLILARVSAAYRQKLQSTTLPTELAKMLPRSILEKRIWLLLSLSAGLTEELLYRSFLTYLLATLFPEISPYLVLLIAALLFGLGHSYQGLTGMLRVYLRRLIGGALYDLWFAFTRHTPSLSDRPGGQGCDSFGRRNLLYAFCSCAISG